MANRKRADMPHQDLAFWGVPDFPVELRLDIVDKAKRLNRTVADIVEEGMTDWLQAQETAKL